jgi:hypothetical protein
VEPTLSFISGTLFGRLLSFLFTCLLVPLESKACTVETRDLKMRLRGFQIRIHETSIITKEQNGLLIILHLT